MQNSPVPCNVLPFPNYLIILRHIRAFVQGHGGTYMKWQGIQYIANLVAVVFAGFHHQVLLTLANRLKVRCIQEPGPVADLIFGSHGLMAQVKAKPCLAWQ